MLDFLIFVFMPVAPIYALACITILVAKDMDNLHVALFGFAITMLLPLLLIGLTWSPANLATYYILATVSLAAKLLYHKHWFQIHPPEATHQLEPMHPPIQVFDKLPPDTRPEAITADLTAVNLVCIFAISAIRYLTLKN